MPRNEKQQQMNLATRTTTAKRLCFHFCFQFPVSISSFHFISISYFSICPSEHQTLFTHICEGLGMRLLPNVLCCSWSLHPNCILSLHLRHSCIFVAYVYPTCALCLTTLVLVINSDWFQILWSYTLLLQLPVLPLTEGQSGLSELSIISFSSQLL